METKYRRKLYSLIRKFEGFRANAYRDSGGVWTCGYGTTGKEVGPDTKYTREDAEKIMNEDAKKFEIGTKNLCPGLERDGLVSISDFAYNLGLTRLSGSTLRRKINKCDREGALREIRRWIYGGGRILPGLIIRRNEEAKLLAEFYNGE